MTPHGSEFDAYAESWWEADGPLRPLHAINPCRLDFINSCICDRFDRDLRTARPYRNLRLLDVGCGGGLICEPMARLGARVCGIDPAASVISVARAHAEEHGLEISYLCAGIEHMRDSTRRFDVVLAMDVIEHVDNPARFVADCADLLETGGLLVASTINRTAASLALAVFAAERLLRWLPVGTHDWRKFPTPGEFDDFLSGAGLRQVASTGIVFDPLRWSWRLSAQDLRVNYAIAGIGTEANR